jgi:hypothetical protein
MPEPKEADLLAYLREHGGRYDLGVLREHLVSHGQEPMAVDAAVQSYLAERSAGKPTGMSPLQTIGVVLLAALSLGVLLVGSCFSVIFLMGNDAQLNRTGLLLAAATVLVFLLLVVLTVAVIRRARRGGREKRESAGSVAS